MIVEYESLRYCQEGVLLNVDGKTKKILFTGGVPGKRFKGGRFCTSDPKIQKLLESRSDFDKRFKVIFRDHTEKEAEEKAIKDLEDLRQLIVPKETVPVIQVPETVPVEPEPVVTKPAEVVSEEPVDESLLEVTNAQKAKDYLVQKIEGLTYRQVQNRAMILSVAERNHIKFPNWQ